MSPLQRARRAARSESGSAYIIALLALFVLTILGLALVVITQNEVQIGANERTINRVFYAADSGLEVQSAKYLLSQGHDFTLTNFTMAESNPGAATNNIAEVIKVTAMVPLTVDRCDWCPANAGNTQNYKVSTLVNATADRLAWVGAGPPPATATNLGEKTIGVVYEFQPVFPPDTDVYNNLAATDLTKVLF
jgi:Tfp pilus assembly protein PilX